jgi:excisionase family DNA binding protein
MEAKPITTTEAAEMLGVSEERVRQLCQAGEIGRKFADRWLLTREEVEDFKPRHKRTRGPEKKSQNNA